MKRGRDEQARLQESYSNAGHAPHERRKPGRGAAGARGTLFGQRAAIRAARHALFKSLEPRPDWRVASMCGGRGADLMSVLSDSRQPLVAEFVVMDLCADSVREV